MWSLGALRRTPASASLLTKLADLLAAKAASVTPQVNTEYSMKYSV
jgi:hypothetical protein